MNDFTAWLLAHANLDDYLAHLGAYGACSAAEETLRAAWVQFGREAAGT